MLLDLLRLLRDRALSLIKSKMRQRTHARQSDAALVLLENEVSANPTAETCNELGIALAELARFDAALAMFDRAIAISPAFAPAYVNRGDAQCDLKQFEGALESYEYAIALKPESAEFYVHRGNALSDLKQYESSLDSYERAIFLKPDYAEAYYNRGEVFQELNRLEAALESYAHALRLKPDYEYLYGLWLHTKMRVCDWHNIAEEFLRLKAKIERRERTTPPFPMVAMSGSLAIQRRAAEDWIGSRHRASDALPAFDRRTASDKIRIGYFSADFHDHATCRLMAELFERHDRSRFELSAFSFGTDTNDAMRQRVFTAFDRFVDIRDQTDMEVAKLARGLEIDIALDLKGFCKDSRTGIFALRAAPIQVNYLGYPGTLGAEYIDYVIADSTLIPQDHRQYYAEKVAYLPYSYQPNDTKRSISAWTPSRAQVGLPQSGFVFCCFNNNFKILPDTFDRWMRILRRVEGSVLWLLEDNAAAAANLKTEAVARGVASNRLVFAQRIALPDHLARHRLADLFLDTLPCNAHTTASDALWAGLPVLTCLGDTFAGRVAASLLNAIGLPDLVASSSAEYEELAISLATDQDKIRKVTQALKVYRDEKPLFDSAQYAKHIEAAYCIMHTRHLSGQKPEHFHVPDLQPTAVNQSG